MSLYHDLLQEQINILKEKGYEENYIGSPDKEGWLFTQLRRGFSDALHQSWQEGESVAFQIATTGFFNDNKNIVHFRFEYEFNLENNSLAMSEMELIADKMHRKIVIQSSKDIPHADQALLIIGEHKQLERKQAAQYIPVHAKKHTKRIR
ncbi:MAG: hypothetical protein KF746_21340 [Chitinophagaceae bacterium]|nr:hypothetical protein [Chitinophagaceae bacterium]